MNKAGILTGMALSASMLLSASVALAQTPHFVYIESNEVAGNRVFGYAQNADGSLTDLPGSPYNAGGIGFADSKFTLGPFDSDQNLAINDDRSLLFAVNSGSNSIAAFHIAADGSLNPVDGSPFASQGINPVSVGVHGQMLVVVNKSQDPNQGTNTVPPNYSSFVVQGNGALAYVPQSAISVAYGSSPSQALLQEGVLFGADFLGGLIQSFRVNGDHLAVHAPQALPAKEYANTSAPRFPLGLATLPQEGVLYVGFVTLNRVGVYRYNQTGQLQYVRSVPNTGVAPCWIVTDSQAKRMYTGNAGDHSITAYDVSNPVEPVELQKLTLAAVGGIFQLALGNGFLYAVEQHSNAAIPEGTGNALHVVKIDSMLSEVASSPTQLNLPGISRAQGVATF